MCNETLGNSHPIVNIGLVFILLFEPRDFASGMNLDCLMYWTCSVGVMCLITELRKPQGPIIQTTATMRPRLASATVSAGTVSGQRAAARPRHCRAC